MTLASVTGWSLAEIDAVPASRAMDLAVSCLEHQADVLETQLTLSLVPVSAFTGKAEPIERLSQRILKLRGVETAWDPAEAEGIAEVEREMAEAYPWYADEARLNKVWQEYGSGGKHRNPDPYSRMAIPPGIMNLIVGM